MEILVLADLYNTLGEHGKATQTIKRGCRWLQGRGSQVFWDKVEDDREFDVADMKLERSVAEGQVAAGMYLLDVNARHRLAISRIKMGDIAEGKVSLVVFLYRRYLEGRCEYRITRKLFCRKMCMSMRLSSLR